MKIDTVVRAHNDIRETDALIIVDVQRDFCAGGALAVPNADEVVPLINDISRRFSVVVASKDWHPADHVSFAANHAGSQVGQTMDTPQGAQILWPAHCVQGSDGAAFHRDLATGSLDAIIHKGRDRAVDSYSAFKDNYQDNHQDNHRDKTTGLAGFLRERGVKRAVLSGLALDYCVLWTARDARDFGFEVVVAVNACRAIDPAAARDQLAKDSLQTADFT